MNPDLAEAGVAASQLPSLTWRDVARAAFAMDTVPAVPVVNAATSLAIGVLSERLLERLRRITHRDLDAFLSEPVVSPSSRSEPVALRR